VTVVEGPFVAARPAAAAVTMRSLQDRLHVIRTNLAAIGGALVAMLPLLAGGVPGRRSARSAHHPVGPVPVPPARAGARWLRGDVPQPQTPASK
jgi:hypothetical protein